MQLAVVGSRHFSNYSLFEEEMNKYLQDIISGGSSGADTLAERYALENKIKVKVFHADWQKYGRRAGPIRNTLIVENATHGIAFLANDSKGTCDKINKLNANSISVHIVNV
jgi:hypothetical protein